MLPSSVITVTVSSSVFVLLCALVPLLLSLLVCISSKHIFKLLWVTRKIYGGEREREELWRCICSVSSHLAPHARQFSSRHSAELPFLSCQYLSFRVEQVIGRRFLLLIYGYSYLIACLEKKSWGRVGLASCAISLASDDDLWQIPASWQRHGRE